VCESLLQRGDDVLVLDDLSTGRLDNLEHVRDRITFRQGSVLDPLLVDSLVEEVDVVVHLAAAVGVRLIVDKPLRSFITNIRGTENVLDAAHRWRRKVLLASTSEIYGKNRDGPLKEDDDRVLGDNRISRWGYSTSKAVDEILAFAYHRERDLPVVVVRLFNTAGPRQTGAYGMVLPRFVEQALAGEPLTVHGDGQQSRCFCHVQDVVRALLLLLENPDADGDVFNVGTQEEITMLQLAERVIDRTDSTSSIDKISYEEAFAKGFEDMRRRVPDTSKIRTVTGWAPTITLDQLIDEVVADARHR
jgi:UDP-glucose 4-epimerase